MEKFTEIEFEGKVYKIKQEHLDKILSKLENTENKNHSNQEIISLMKKYQLLDIDFLDTISKL